MLFSRGCLLPTGAGDHLCWVPNCCSNPFCQAVIPQTITFSSYCLNVSVFMCSNPDPRVILYRGRIFRKWLSHKSTVFVSEIDTQEKTSQLGNSFLQVRISWAINRLKTAKSLIREQPAWRPDHRIPMELYGIQSYCFWVAYSIEIYRGHLNGSQPFPLVITLIGSLVKKKKTLLLCPNSTLGESLCVSILRLRHRSIDVRQEDKCHILVRTSHFYSNPALSQSGQRLSNSLTYRFKSYPFPSCWNMHSICKGGTKLPCSLKPLPLKQNHRKQILGTIKGAKVPISEGGDVLEQMSWEWSKKLQRCCLS